MKLGSRKFRFEWVAESAGNEGKAKADVGHGLPRPNRAGDGRSAFRRRPQNQRHYLSTELPITNFVLFNLEFFYATFTCRF